jgi:hypothetical protein
VAQQHTIDRETFNKLRKVWAMRGSTHAGERAAAEQAAVRLVARFGYGLHDIEQLLANGGQPILKTAWEQEEKNRRQRHAAEREAVIRRYGSLEAVLAWQPREQLLREAVAHLCVFKKAKPDGVVSIDGWTLSSPRAAPRRVMRLLSEAYRLPATITEAQEEFGYWATRDRDLCLALESDPANGQLDLPAWLRYQIVGDLLGTGLRANSISEVLLRQRHLVNSGMFSAEIEDAVLRDLEHLAAGECRAGVQIGQSATTIDQSGVRHATAKQRRAAVIELLSNLDTRTLADREIARRVGVSPQTVGNIRRRLGQNPGRAMPPNSSDAA